MPEFFEEFGSALIGLFGVVLGSVLVGFREWFTQRTARNREASYSAIRLVCILEEFASKCAEVAVDDGYAAGRPAGRTESGEEYCVAQAEKPDPLDFPNDIAWRSLEENLMHRILALPNKARSTEKYLSICAENACPPYYSEVFEPRQEGYARLGIDTLVIVEELRKRYKISVESSAEIGIDWDQKAHLEDVIEKIAKVQAKREERRQARLAKSASDGSEISK